MKLSNYPLLESRPSKFAYAKDYFVPVTKAGKVVGHNYTYFYYDKNDNPIGRRIIKYYEKKPGFTRRHRN